MGSALVLPTSAPRLSSPWEQLQWPEEAQVVGGKVSSISTKPEEAQKSGKRDVREQQGSGVPSCSAPPLLTASTSSGRKVQEVVLQASCLLSGEGRSSKMG